MMLRLLLMKKSIAMQVFRVFGDISKDNARRKDVDYSKHLNRTAYMSEKRQY